jgi:zinc transporter ZupT
MIVWIIALATFASTLLGGLFAIKFSDKLHLILGFSAGTVMGIALFDLIPESLDLASKSYSTALTTLLMGAGFIFYMIFDRYFSIHNHGHEHCENPKHSNNIGAITLVIHSFIDGLAIGLSFMVSNTVGWVVAIAVLSHDFSDGINTVSAILKGQNDKKKATKWLVFDALAPAAGVLVASLMTVSEAQLGLILAFFVGLFLYLGASDLVPESHHRHPAFWTSAMTVLGMAAIYIAILLGK